MASIVAHPAGGVKPGSVVGLAPCEPGALLRTACFGYSCQTVEHWMGERTIKIISTSLLCLLLTGLVCAGDPESAGEPQSARFGMQGKITAVEGKGDELAQIMLQASRVVSTMDGCELYIVQQSMTDESVILISEVWADRASHQASLSDERVRELIARARPIIAGMEGHPANFVGGHGLREAGGQH